MTDPTKLHALLRGDDMLAASEALFQDALEKGATMDTVDSILLGIGQQLCRIADVMERPLEPVTAAPVEYDEEGREKPKLRYADGTDLVAALRASMEAVKARRIQETGGES